MSTASSSFVHTIALFCTLLPVPSCGILDGTENTDSTGTTANSRDTAAMTPKTNRAENSFVAISNGEYAIDQLERCGKWLASIPRDDITVLRHTIEFQEFLASFERLGQAHIRVVVNNQSPNAVGTTQISPAGPRAFGAHHPAEANKKPSGLGNAPIDAPHNQHAEEGNGSAKPNRKRSAAHATAVDAGNPRRSNESNDDDDVSMKDPPDGAATRGGAGGLHGNATPTSGNNFLRFTDDVLLRIFEFLRCRCLIQASRTCSRFHQLAGRSAFQRSSDVLQTRQLGSVMQLLRAREQIHYTDEDAAASGTGRTFHVPVPLLLPSRRVRVANAGDPEYNGVYYCTECSCNGFVFTKPRGSAMVRAENGEANNGNMVVPQQYRDLAFHNNNNNNNINNNFIINNNIDRNMNMNMNVDDWFQPQRQHQHDPHQQIATMPDDRSDSDCIEETPLRCIISKAYSGNDLLWYMSKEVEVTDGGSRRRKTFSFYAPLLLDAPPDLPVYPSQTSMLVRQHQRWRGLAGSTTIQPPTVEVIDADDLDL
ncbi:unnamed protein product [Pseudo-nitzschia multistriata]|uniref:F-box domain-containing protein n=1 Tax=Pseudo-nitzschia multistriata TaxID=183589 RepID=A0A448ZGQ2_9STRA|nr:unnamed protein product [Pseudo-nitzschia multistriata]